MRTYVRASSMNLVKRTSNERRNMAATCGSAVQVEGLKPSSSIMKDSDEVGYLFLEDAEAAISLEACPSDSRNVVLPTRTWLDVEWDNDESLDNNELASTEQEEEENINVDDNICCRCNLVLHAEQQGTAENAVPSVQKLRLKKPPRFNGTVSDMACTCPDCVDNRSDAALLVGTAFTCQSHGHVAIRNIHVLVREEQRSSSSHAVTKVSLVITFAMPALTNNNSQQQGLRSILPSNNKSTRKSAVKPLPPSTQLLLAILKSDWRALENKMIKLSQTQTTTVSRPSFVYQLESDGTLKKTKRTMFPPKLSLEELYLRLQGISHDATRKISDTTPQQSSLLTSLPQDVLVTSIAPFLHAKSLEALRMSCKHCHYALRATVPGMKLRLYSHQVRSLEWMRRRETRELSEQVALNVSTNSLGGGEECSVGADLHRAVTGGATTLLRRRGTYESFRINQQTGMQIPYDDMGQSNGTFALSRHIARGGLLCDDPGLGKTITVLSLILQTSGLSTEPKDGKPSSRSHTDEDIFQAYWSEHVPFSPYRRMGYTKCLNALRKHPDARMFEFPVDPVRDHCPDYLNVVDDPISLSEIESKIAEDYRFQDFESDVNRCFQ